MYGRITHPDQLLIINQKVLSGVTNFDGNFDIPYENIDVLGGNYLAETEGELGRDISISRVLINKDPLKSLTGEAPCSGFINYKDLSFGFQSGYLTSYSVSCDVGSIAEINTDFIVYGNMGGNINYNIPPSDPNDELIYVANYGNIFVSVNEGSTNRIVGFSYSVSCERVPTFVLGSIDPKEVFLKKPVIAELTLNIEIDDYESDDIQNLLCNPNIQNITIDLKNCDNTVIMESFFMPNARLISNSYNGNIGDAATIELLFRSFLV
jgi:hypothetical protein